MKITCTTCGAPYEVDDAQIPPGGATMKCSQCHASFNVQPPSGNAAGGNNRYHIKRASGNVLGPFLEQAIASMLEQGKLNGDEQLSLDGVSWMPMSQVPRLAQITPPGDAPAEDDGFADLPAPKGAIVPPAPPGPSFGDMADLPAPVGMVPPPPSAPAGGGMGELDLDDGMDLPAPVGAMPPALTPAALPTEDDGFADLPAPKGAISAASSDPMNGMNFGQLDLSSGGGDDSGLADLPAPKGAIDAGISDLPAPVGAQPLVPPPPGPDLGLADLPAPVGARPPGTPNTGLDLGGPDISDLPAPVGADDFSDLPAPVGAQPLDAGLDLGGPDLGGPDISDLPAPVGAQPLDAGLDLGGPDISDLPAPKDSALDLSGAGNGITDLPQPKIDSNDNLNFGGELDDLPTPAGSSSGLELDADFDLPVPKEDAQPAAGIPDLVSPLDLNVGDTADVTDDLLAPKDDSLIEGDDDVVSTFEPPPMMDEDEPAPEPVFTELAPPQQEQAQVEEEVAPITRPSNLKQRLLVALGALVGVVLIGGITVGFITDYGFFGMKLLSGDLNKEQQTKGLLSGAKLLLQKDTFKDYGQAAADLELAASKLPEDPQPKALQGQVLASLAVRYGPDPARRAQAKQLATLVTTSAEAAQQPQVKKLHGLLSLAFGRPAEAITTLAAVADSDPGDAQAAIYLGWAQLAAKQPQKARAAFSRALAAVPGHAAAHYGTAQALFMTNATTPALAALDKVLKISPNHPSALILRARIEIKKNQPGAAAKTLKLATTAGLTKASRSERGQAYSTLGQLALLEGNNNEAHKQFEQACKINPRDAEALLGLGDLHLTARRYSEALAHYQQARGLNPTLVPPALKIVRTHIATREFTKAQKVLVQIRRLAPQAPEVLFLLGLVEAAANNLDNAETHFNAVIKKNPTYFPPYLHLSQLHLKRQKAAEAMAVLKAAGEQLPGSPLVRNAEGEILLATKQLESAQAKFEEALRLDANLNKALFNLGLTFLRQGKLDKAQAQLEALKGKDRDFPGLWEHLGALHMTRKNYAKASSAYELALKDPAASQALRLSAAYCYNQIGKPDLAIVQSRAVLKSKPGQPYALALLAEASLLKKDKDEALVQIRQAADREKTAYIMLIKGRVHEARGEKADAVDAYQAVLKLDPQRDDVRFLSGRMLISTGSLKAGIKLLNVVIKNKPDMAEAYLWLGIGYAEGNNELKALGAYKTAVAKDPKLATARFRLGQVLFDRRSYRPALSSLKKAVAQGAETDSWMAEANYYLGETAFALKRKQVAAEAYYTFKRLDSTSALVREVNKRLRSMGLPLRKKPTK